MKNITSDLYIIEGSVNGGVIVHDNRVVLIDAPELSDGRSIQAELNNIGVNVVDRIYLTQGRRFFCGGLFQPENEALCSGHTLICASAGEKKYLETANERWNSNYGLYHRYEQFPDQFLPFDDLRIDETVYDGYTFSWYDFEIRCIQVNAQSAGDCVYLVKNKKENNTVLFCGSFAMADGRIRELYSLQKALPDMMGYHGHMAGLIEWKRAAEKIRTEGPELMVPAYGDLIYNPAECLNLLECRLQKYTMDYVAAGAVRYYFPDEFKNGFEIPMEISEGPRWCRITEHPKWLSRIGDTTSYLIRSESGHAFMIDAGDAAAVEYVISEMQSGRINSLDALWITHYHDDHLNSIGMFTHAIECPIISTASVEEVCRNPEGYYLPALCDSKVHISILADRTSWEWEGFKLTALHFPAQSLYHAGLLVEKGDDRVLLCGDGFAPTGFDDYCPYNRNLLGNGRGYRLCLDILKEYNIHQLVNEHQTEPFYYDDEYISFLEKNLDERDGDLKSLLPSDIDFGLDSEWIRVWPADQTVIEGSYVRFAVQITGHGKHSVRAALRLPWTSEHPEALIETDELTSGSTRVSAGLPRDRQVFVDVRLKRGLTGRYFIPVDCWMDDVYLGSFTYAALSVVPY